MSLDILLSWKVRDLADREMLNLVASNGIKNIN